MARRRQEWRRERAGRSFGEDGIASIKVEGGLVEDVDAPIVSSAVREDELPPSADCGLGKGTGAYCDAGTEARSCYMPKGGYRDEH